MKLDAPRAWGTVRRATRELDYLTFADRTKPSKGRYPVRVRVLRETDYRRLLRRATR